MGPPVKVVFACPAFVANDYFQKRYFLTASFRKSHKKSAVKPSVYSFHNFRVTQMLLLECLQGVIIEETIGPGSRVYVLVSKLQWQFPRQ